MYEEIREQIQKERTPGLIYEYSTVLITRLPEITRERSEGVGRIKWG